MRAAELRRRGAGDGAVEGLARVWADGPGLPAHVHVYDPELRAGIEMILGLGVVSSDGRSLGLEDGEEFVAALPSHYHSSRMWAVEVPANEEGESAS